MLAGISMAQPKPRGPRAGVDVAPGLIRLARLDAGLSMANLAGGDVSRQAIFLIESGRTRPSMRTLEMIATRTGRPLSYFLTGESGTPAEAPLASDPRTGQLQALCLQQRFDEARTLGMQILEQKLVPATEAHVRVYVGQALVRLTSPDEALEHLRKAELILETAPDPWLGAECADWRACALYLKEDGRALGVAERALKLCRSTEPRLPGTEVRILEHIATIHVKNHTFDKAVAYYEEALALAGGVRDLARLGRTYHGLSIAYQERGDIARAIEFTHKALALYALENDKALLARGENELGLLLMRQGQMGRAEEAFRSALEHLGEAGTERAMSHVLLSLADLQLQTRRHVDAAVTIRQAINLAERLGETLALSTGHMLMAQSHERMGRHQLADRAFAKAFRLLKGEALRDRLAESHAAYAQVLEARGDVRRAGRHWKLAAEVALQRRSNRTQQTLAG